MEPKKSKTKKTPTKNQSPNVSENFQQIKARKVEETEKRSTEGTFLVFSYFLLLIFLPFPNFSIEPKKLLHEMTAQDVQKWFQTCDGGIYEDYYQKFKGLKGSQLSKMTKDDFRSEFPNSPLTGSLIFNELQELKTLRKIQFFLIFFSQYHVFFNTN